MLPDACQATRKESSEVGSTMVGGAAGRSFPREERRLFRYGLVFVGLAFAALAAPAYRGLVYCQDDLGRFHYPLRQFYRACLLHGDNFTWLPSLFCGVYLLGEGQAGLLHPVHLLLYRLLPLPLAFNVEFLGIFVAMFVGCYLMLRRLTLAPHAALFGAVVATFSGFFFLHAVHMNCEAILAHLPWLLLCIDTVLRGEKTRLPLATGGIVALTASQVLLGHPQFVYLSLLVEGAYVVFMWRSIRHISRPLLILAAEILAALVGAVQLLPTLDFLHHSTRSVPSAYWRYDFSLHPLNVLQFVSPGLFRGGVYKGYYGNIQEFSLYTGPGTVLLAVWAAMRYRALGKWRYAVLAAALMGVVGLLLGFGGYTPVYRVWSKILPLARFRCPCRQVLLVHLALAFVGGIAFADLAHVAFSKTIIPYKRLWPLAALPALGGSISAILLIERRFGAPAWSKHLVHAVGPTADVVAGIVVMAFAMLLIVAGARGWRRAPVWLLGLTVISLMNYGLAFLRRTPPGRPEAIAKLWHYPATNSGYRLSSTVWGGDGNMWMLLGRRSTGGYLGLYPERQLDYSTIPVQRVAGVGWRETGKFGSLWQPIPDPLPRARLVTRTRISTQPGHDIAHTNVDTTALIDRGPELTGGQPGTVSIVEDRPGRITLTTHAPTRQFLVLSESYHQGWSVRVDGRAEPVRRAYGDFMGCFVGPGTHRVEFRFLPRSLVEGAAVSGVGLLLTLLALIVLARQCRGRVAGVDGGVPPCLAECKG